MNERAVVYRNLNDIPAEWGNSRQCAGDGVRCIWAKLCTRAWRFTARTPEHGRETAIYANS